MTDDHESPADEIPEMESEEEAMIRWAIERSLPQNDAERAMAWLERASNALAALRELGIDV